jgi:hypothetical protein
MSIGDLFSKSWKLYKNSFWRLIAVVLIPMAVLVGASLIVFALGFVLFASSFAEFIGLPETASLVEIVASVGFPLIFALVLVLVALVGNFWFEASQLVAVREARSIVDIKKSLKEGWASWASYAWVFVLVGLAVAAVPSLFIILGRIFQISLLSILGFILLIPGIIFAIWFFFSEYALIFDGFKGVAALKRSKGLVQGYWWAVFGRLILMGLITFAFSFVPLVDSIGSFLAGIYAIVYFSVLYEDLKRVKG